MSYGAPAEAVPERLEEYQQAKRKAPAKAPGQDILAPSVRTCRVIIRPGSLPAPLTFEPVFCLLFAEARVDIGFQELGRRG